MDVEKWRQFYVLMHFSVDKELGLFFIFPDILPKAGCCG